MEDCLRSRDQINVVAAGKQSAPQWLDPDAALAHVQRGIGIWDWASNDAGGLPDVVLACCGDVPTVETLAAVMLLRRHLPQLRVRVVNVVDLMRLQDPAEHPHGLTDREYDALFPPARPVIFAFHGYPLLIHRLTYRWHNHDHIHVRGYREEGTTTTPFDMLVLNDLDRLPPGRRRDRPGAVTRGTPRCTAPAHARRAAALPRAHPPHRHRRARRARLALARRVALTAGRWSRVEVPVGPGPAGPNT
jgi:hypothetical protein